MFIVINHSCILMFSLACQSFSNIFSLLQSVKARDEGKANSSEQVQPEEPKPVRHPPAPTHGYSRYDQERFKGQEGKSLWKSSISMMKKKILFAIFFRDR